jgi:hypothetical protein
MTYWHPPDPAGYRNKPKQPDLSFRPYEADTIIARLTRERDEALAQVEAADRRWATAADECDRLRALLREVEHGGRSGASTRHCPCCGCYQGADLPHYPDCRIKAELEAP